MNGYDSSPMQRLWAWSLPCGRIAGIPVSIHWTLLLLSAFTAVGAIQDGLAWWWLPVLLLIPPLSVALHECGHAAAARLAGGDCERIILWMFGGVAMCQAPARPWPQFAVAAAGPLVSLLIAVGCLLGVAVLAGDPFAGGRKALALGGAAGAILAYAAFVNLAILALNLLPCHPLDGGRMARAALWPLVGRDRAVRWTIVLAYVGLAAIAAWALWRQDLLLLILALMLFMNVFIEHGAVRQGYDPEFGDAAFIGGQTGGTVLSRWRDRREAARAERTAAAAAAEQAELDRLLAKVSAQGLPSLSAAERRMLQRISERERSRSGG